MKKITMILLMGLMLLSTSLAIKPVENVHCKIRAFGFQEESLSLYNHAYWELYSEDCKGGFMVNMEDTATGNIVASMIFPITHDYQHTTGRFIAEPQGELILHAYRITEQGDVIYKGSSVTKGKPQWGYYPVLTVN